MTATATPDIEKNAEWRNVETLREDPFLSLDELIPVKRQAAERDRRRTLSEMESMVRDTRWQDMVDLFHPVAEKLPDICAFGLDTPVRGKLAFAMGHLNMFDDAIREIGVCIEKEPDNFLFRSSMAYTAYNSLYAAKNREITLAGKARDARIRLAHDHFEAARRLRPDGVTNFYREGMLFKQIENKRDKALPLFRKAVDNWEKLDEAERLSRHQEKKNYVKSLYQLAGGLLDAGNPEEALNMIRKCVAEDEKTHHISLLFKYFAMGKIHHHLNEFTEARDALLFALQSRQGQPADYVNELLGRTWLMMDQPDKALDIVLKVPEKYRRPYVRWTEADVRCALKDLDGARKALTSCLDRDRRSRHKTLVRLAKIEYLTGNYEQAMKYGADADRFFRQAWGNPHDEGLFWQAAGAFQAGDREKALGAALELKARNPGFPKLGRLLDEIQGMAEK